MNYPDPVLQRLAQLPPCAPSDATSARICEFLDCRTQAKGTGLRIRPATEGQVGHLARIDVNCNECSFSMSCAAREVRMR